MIKFLVVSMLLSSFVFTFAQSTSRNRAAQSLPPGYWPLEKTPIVWQPPEFRKSAPNWR